MSDNPLMRDAFNPELIKVISERIHAQYSLFNTTGFVKAASANLDSLGLMERSN